MAQLKKKASLSDFQIVGYDGAYKGVNVLFILDTQDEDLKKQILNNNLSPSERNFIISSISEYFESQIQSDERLYDYGVGDIIIDMMEGTMKYPEGLLDKKLIENKCCVKQRSSGEMTFSKVKFRGLPLSERLPMVKDYAEFFDYVWGDTYQNRQTDINNLVIVKGAENAQVIEDLMTSGASKFSIKMHKILAEV